MLHRWIVVVLCLGTLLLGANRTLYAEDDPLARASKLRNDSGKDWNNKDYTAAAKKLEEALAIYDRIEGASLLDRAITLRALVWNLVRSGDLDGATSRLTRLMAMAVADETAWPEVNTAWLAIWEAASKMDDLAPALRLLEGLRAEAKKAKLDRLVGQALHDMGSLAVKHEDGKAAADAYARAIKVRSDIGDVDGEAWSRNNLANLHLMAGRLDEALEPLAGAYKLVHTESVDAAQGAIAWNLRKAIELMLDDPQTEHVTWLQATAKHAEKSRRATWVPAEHLHRTALRVAEATGKSSTIKKVALSLTKFPARRAAPEIVADLTIRAAQAAARAGQGKKARSWLAKLDVGDGPCRAHLDARKKTALALTLAEKSGSKKFPGAAREAATAWRDLGDFEGRREALQAIADAAAKAGFEERIPKVLEEQRAARRAGGPGGDGGSATSGGDRSSAGDVPLRGVAFHIRLDGEKILIEDKIAHHKTELPYRWKPAGVTINGLSVKSFGGYVVIEAMNYGGSSAGTAMRGSTTLDALGVYMPLPAKGTLIVQKNGAVRYTSGPLTGGR